VADHVIEARPSSFKVRSLSGFLHFILFRCSY
jgi:hypothetical protein